MCVCVCFFETMKRARRHPKKHHKHRHRKKKKRKGTPPPPRRACYPFDKTQALPTEAERKRLLALVQGSPEWKFERLKRLGASGASCASGWGIATPLHFWMKRMNDPRLMQDEDPAATARMKRGNDLEPEGADAAAWLMKYKLGTAGIVVHPRLSWIHCSPDRIVLGTKGIVEIKCPAYCIPSRLKDQDSAKTQQYLMQVQQQMEIMQAEWCDLVFYYKNQAETKVEVEIWRIWRNPAYWAIMEPRLNEFADALMENREPKIKTRPKMPHVRMEKQLYRCYQAPASSSSEEKKT